MRRRRKRKKKRDQSWRPMKGGIRDGEAVGGRRMREAASRRRAVERNQPGAGVG